MSDILLDVQSPSATPAAGQLVIYADSVSKVLSSKNDAGAARAIAGIRNANTADVVANAADTYLAGSALAIPGHLLQAGAIFRWKLVMTKSGAGIAPPTWIIRVGTGGAVTDTARVTFTGPAQTGVIDTGWVDIVAVLRNTGAAGVLAAGLMLGHNLATTGFANIANPTLQVTSAGFDTTLASLIVGLSVNPGASGVWTHQVVEAELVNN